MELVNTLWTEVCILPVINSGGNSGLNATQWLNCAMNQALAQGLLTM